jgi:tripartite-type tricarboxylate transporter receptor subunit TctC
MKFLHFLICALWVSLAAPAMAWQPTKPIEVLIAWPPGSGNDIVFRTLAPQVEAKHGVKFVITNLPGAGGVVGTEKFSRMPADGYHINVVSVGGLAAMDRTFPAFWEKEPYNLDNFEYVTLLASAPLAVIASRNDPVSDPKSLLQVFKTQSITVADSGGGGRLGLESILIRSEAKKTNPQLVRVEHKGPSQTVIDVGGRHVRFGTVPLSVAISHHNDPNGSIKIVALTSQSRHPDLPSIGTISEVLPGFDVPVSWGLMVPRGTPKEAINWYAQSFKQALATEQTKQVWQKNLFATDFELTDPTKFDIWIRSQNQKNRPIVDEIIKDIKGPVASNK